MKYEEIEPYLIDFIKGQAEEATEYRIRAYLKQHPEFEEELDELRTTLEYTQEIPLEEPAPSMKMDFYAMLNKAKAEEKKDEKISFWAAFLQSFWTKRLVLVVSIALIFFTGYWSSQLFIFGGGDTASSDQMSMETPLENDSKQSEEQIFTESEEEATEMADASDSTVQEESLTKTLKQIELKPEKKPTYAYSQEKKSEKAGKAIPSKNKGNENSLNKPLVQDKEMAEDEYSEAPVMSDIEVVEEEVTSTQMKRSNNTRNLNPRTERIYSGDKDVLSSQNLGRKKEKKKKERQSKSEKNMLTDATNPKSDNINNVGLSPFGLNNQTSAPKLGESKEGTDTLNVDESLWIMNPYVEPIQELHKLEKTIQKEDTQKLLLKILEEEQDASIQMAIIDLLVKYKIKNSSETLKKLLKDPNLDPETRQKAEEALKVL